MRRTRVLVISRPGIGGAAKHVSLLVEFIDKKRFHVTAALSALEDPGYPERLRERGIRVIPLDMAREPSPLRDLGTLFRLLGILYRGKYDVVHAHTTKPGLLGRVAAALLGIRSVFYTPHGFYFDYPLPRTQKLFYLSLERLLGPLTRKILVTSRAEAEDLVRRRIFPPRKVVAIPNAIPIPDRDCQLDPEPAAERKRLGVDPEAPLVGMVGRLSPPKDPGTFVEAARLVADAVDQARFLLVGDGDLHGETARSVQKLGLSDRVLLLGNRPDALRLISLFDVSVLSSRHEGLPMFLLESMALAKPVVASRVSGCADVILEGKTGFLVEPGNPRELADRVLELLRNKELARKVGEAGRRHVAENFEAAAWIEKIEQVYLS